MDSGVEAGDEISPYYDPMLGKLIAWGESRIEAANRLAKALAELEVVGVTTNRSLLMSVLADDEFQRAPVATDFLRDAARAPGIRRAPPDGGGCRARRSVVRDPRNSNADALWADTTRLAAGRRRGCPLADRR